ncbi:MAG: hypothetical protein ACXWNQ_06480 [Anaerolineales bacterium]
MQTRLLLKLFLLLASVSLACSLTAPAAPKAQAILDNIQVDYHYTNELITVIYPLYGSKLDDFVIVTLTNTNKTPVKIKVESEITDYSDMAIDTVDLNAGEKTEVRQNPRLKPEMIDQLNVEKPAQVHVRVTLLQDGAEQSIYEQTDDISVYARRDFPWAISGFTDAEVYQMLGAMVTPNDPSVEALLRTAANHTTTQGVAGTIWGGYGGHVNDDNGAVWDRLQAIWQAENDDSLAYVNTTVSFAPGHVQRIRLPYEVLQQNSGNCIELALLYASAAEALDLQSAIILIPGHAYVGVRTDDTNNKYYYIETTLIGRASFDEATTKGSQEFTDALPHINANEVSYAWVSIAGARQAGILPLPWH